MAKDLVKRPPVGVSKDKPCEVCGKSVKARGYKSHLRLAHKLVLNVTTKVVKASTQVADSSPSLFPDVSPTTQVARTQVIEQVTELRSVQIAGHGGSVISDHSPLTPFAEKVAYWRKFPEKAALRWERLVELQKKYGWVNTQFPDEWDSLKRALGIEGRGY